MDKPMTAEQASTHTEAAYLRDAGIVLLAGIAIGAVLGQLFLPDLLRWVGIA